VTALLVTNDFPPKIGGIQSYLYDLWQRLPTANATVMTTRYPGAPEWDAAQPFRIVRARERQFWPTPSLARRIDALAREIGADVIFLDPWFPLGGLGPRLAAAPTLVVVHGAEVTVLERLPIARSLGRRGLRHARGVVAAGGYPATQATRAAGVALNGVVIPPGVDVARFRPFTSDERRAARAGFGIAPDRPLVVGVSRLVPRKGFDVLIDAVGRLRPDVQLVIAGDGRDHARLARRAARVAPGRVRFLGRVPDRELPALYACADVFAMPCRDRWAGLEAEGFGIVFAEAGACGVPVVAGRSGGSPEAVVDGETGYVVTPRAGPVRDAIDRLLADASLRAAMGEAARARAVSDLSLDVLAQRLAPLADGDLSTLGPLP
jgi:phosphatidylinositol alpha-1,6-mannosyltransferase